MPDRFIVYVQDLDTPHRVHDTYGIFKSWTKANEQCKRLQKLYPDKWVGIRELLKPSKD